MYRLIEFVPRLLDVDVQLQIVAPKPYCFGPPDRISVDQTISVGCDNLERSLR